MSETLRSTKAGPVVPVTAEQLEAAAVIQREWRAFADQFGKSDEWREVYRMVRAARRGERP